MNQSKFRFAFTTLCIALVSQTVYAQDRHSIYPFEETDYEPSQFSYGVGPDTGSNLMNKPVRAGDTQWIEFQSPGLRQQTSSEGLLQSATVFFAFDSTLPLNPEALRVIPVKPETKIRLTGRTDPVGTASYNDRLGLQRAEAIAALFVQQGMLRSQIEAISLGSRSPVAPNDSEEGRRINRQVSIEIRSE